VLREGERARVPVVSRFGFLRGRGGKPQKQPQARALSSTYYPGRNKNARQPLTTGDTLWYVNPLPGAALKAAMLDLATARAILAVLDAACERDPSLRALRDSLWDAIIDAEARSVEGVRW